MDSSWMKLKWNMIGKGIPCIPTTNGHSVSEELFQVMKKSWNKNTNKLWNICYVSFRFLPPLGALQSCLSMLLTHVICSFYGRSFCSWHWECVWQQKHITQKKSPEPMECYNLQWWSFDIRKKNSRDFFMKNIKL